MPRVSLALPVYNGERFITDAITSILGQSFADFELIITDNASTDGTEEICRRFARSDARVRYFRNERNLGAADNFNWGFRLASGELFKWCAHDDRISANYLDACVTALADNPDAVLAHGRQCGIDAEGKETGWTSGDLRDINGVSDAKDRFKLVFATQGFDVAMFGVIRSAALAKTDLHQKYYGSDIALLSELALLGSFVGAEGAAFYNRDHPDRSVNATDKRARQFWHDTNAKRFDGLEHIRLLRHLVAISYKQRAKAPMSSTAVALMLWAASPRQLARYGLEVVGLVSPQVQSRLRTGGQGMLRAISRARLRDVAESRDG